MMLLSKAEVVNFGGVDSNPLIKIVLKEYLLDLGLCLIAKKIQTNYWEEVLNYAVFSLISLSEHFSFKIDLSH